MEQTTQLNTNDLAQQIQTVDQNQLIKAYKEKVVELYPQEEFLAAQSAIQAFTQLSSQEEADSVASLMTIVAGFEKKTSEYWEPIKSGFFKLHRMITAAERETLAPLAALTSKSKSLIGDFIERERKAREEAARLAEKIKREQEELAAREYAAKMREGDVEAAEQVQSRMTALQFMVPDAITDEKSKVNGIASTTDYEVKITNLKDLCRGVADGLVPEEAIEPALSFIKKNAKATNGKLNWPGIALNPISGVKRTGR